MYISALVANMLQSEGQIPEKTVTKTSTELVSYFGKYKPIPEIKDTKLTSDSPHFLSTKLGISYF